MCSTHTECAHHEQHKIVRAPFMFCVPVFPYIFMWPVENIMDGCVGIFDGGGWRLRVFDVGLEF